MSDENSENQTEAKSAEQSVDSSAAPSENASEEKKDSQSLEENGVQTEEDSNSEPVEESNPNAKWYILQAYAGYETRVEKTIYEKLRIEKNQRLSASSRWARKKNLH